MSRDLTDAQVRTAEDHVAYEGDVELLSWQDTSAHGFKIRLRLADRGQLDYFDGVMTMRKRRGGQRYHAIATDKDGDILRQFESQFCGRGWAESKGAHIALHVGELDTITWLRERTCKDQVEAEYHGDQWRIMLMELDDDQTIVNQAKRAMTLGVVDPQPKGGPRSKAVARLLQDEDFLEWLNRRSLYARHNVWRDAELADKLVKQRLNIDSKVELDCSDDSDEKWALWESQFHRPFLHYMQRSRKV